MDQFNQKYANHASKRLILEASNSVCVALRSAKRFDYDNLLGQFFLRYQAPQVSEIDDSEETVSDAAVKANNRDGDSEETISDAAVKENVRREKINYDMDDNVDMINESDDDMINESDDDMNAGKGDEFNDADNDGKAAENAAMFAEESELMDNQEDRNTSGHLTRLRTGKIKKTDYCKIGKAAGGSRSLGNRKPKGHGNRKPKGHGNRKPSGDNDKFNDGKAAGTAMFAKESELMDNQENQNTSGHVTRLRTGKIKKTDYCRTLRNRKQGTGNPSPSQKRKFNSREVGREEIILRKRKFGGKHSRLETIAEDSDEDNSSNQEDSDEDNSSNQEDSDDALGKRMAKGTRDPSLTQTGKFNSREVGRPVTFQQDSNSDGFDIPESNPPRPSTPQNLLETTPEDPDDDNSPKIDLSGDSVNPSSTEYIKSGDNSLGFLNIFPHDDNSSKMDRSGVAKLRTVLFNRFKELVVLCSLFWNIMEFLPSAEKYMLLNEVDAKIRDSLAALHYSAEDLRSLPPVTAATVDQLMQLPGMRSCLLVESGTKLYISLNGDEENDLFFLYRDMLMNEDLGGDHHQDEKDDFGDLRSDEKDELDEERRRTIYYPSNAARGVPVAYKDLDGLEPGEFVSSEVVNFYIRYILEIEWLDETIFIASSYLYSLLERDSVGEQFLSLRQWFIKDKLLYKRLLFFPVNMDKSGHWSLIIVWNFKDKDEVFILHLDSLEFHKKFQLFKIFENSFAKIWNHLKGEGGEKASKFVYRFVESPRQEGPDCALFVLHYIELFLKNPPESVDEFIKIAKNWFPANEPVKLRKVIKELLLEEFRKLDEGSGDE